MMEYDRKISIEDEWETEIMCKFDFISCIQCFIIKCCYKEPCNTKITESMRVYKPITAFARSDFDWF